MRIHVSRKKSEETRSEFGRFEFCILNLFRISIFGFRVQGTVRIKDSLNSFLGAS